MDGTTDGWVASSLARLDEANVPPWTDATSERTEPMTTVTLYATNSDLVCAQKNDGPVWEFGPVTPDMYGEFAELALAWHDGDWEPNENDGQHAAGSDEGLEPVAVWNSKDLHITYPAGEGVEHLGGAAQRWIHGSEERRS